MAPAVFLATLAAACGADRSETIDHARAHAASLVASTRPLWEKHRGGEVPASEYPPEVRALEPQMVSAADHGVLIYVRTSYAHVTGVFVRHDPAFVPPGPTPPDSDAAGYELLGQDVYWYSQPR